LLRIARLQDIIMAGHKFDANLCDAVALSWDWRASRAVGIGAHRAQVKKRSFGFIALW